MTMIHKATSSSAALFVLFTMLIVSSTTTISTRTAVEAFSTTTTVTTTSLSRSSSRWRLYYHYFSGGTNNNNNKNNNNFNNNQRSFTVPPRSIPPNPARPQPSVSSSSTTTKDEVLQWEAEIQESAMRGVDLLRIQEWLDNDENDNNNNNWDPTTSTTQRDRNGWKVAIASGTVMGLGCDYITHSITLSLITFATVVWVALKDPLDDADGLVGPLARIVGRTTLDSYQKVKPKLKALARAAIQNEDVIIKLSSEVKELRQQNQELRLYQQRREWIDAHQSQFSLEDLKGLAQKVRLSSYSTLSKQQLMMRLLETGALRMTNFSRP